MSTPPVYGRNEVIRRLRETDLDIVYLYCHAEGGKGTGLRPPVLTFRRPGQGSDSRIPAKDLDAEPGRIGRW